MIKEYICEDCGNLVEIWVRFDKVPDICPTCGGTLKKIISKSSFQLKGVGWYQTDYKNKKHKSRGKGE